MKKSNIELFIERVKVEANIHKIIKIAAETPSPLLAYVDVILTEGNRK